MSKLLTKHVEQEITCGFVPPNSNNTMGGFVPSKSNIHTGGSIPQVLSPQGSRYPLSDNNNTDSEISQKSRLFLLSKKSKKVNNSAIDTSPRNNQSKTKNGKYISYAKAIKHNGKTYKVNANKSKGQGIYTGILHKAIDQLEVCEFKWKRVFVLFFNLHQKNYYTRDNKHISQFRKNLNRRLEREYEMAEIAYLWVREQEKAKAQHYHFVLFLDGNKIRYSSKILRTIKDTWENINTVNTMPVIKNPYYFIDNGETKADAIYRMSYLTKVRGKGYRDKHVKDYSTSRLIDKDLFLTVNERAVVVL